METCRACRYLVLQTMFGESVEMGVFLLAGAVEFNVCRVELAER
jgi:hypothetical protein